jgi:hypothetical protein
MEMFMIGTTRGRFWVAKPLDGIITCLGWRRGSVVSTEEGAQGSKLKTWLDSNSMTIIIMGETDD